MTTQTGPDPSRARATASAEVFVLSCIDYRLVDDITRYLERRGLGERYSEMRIAGAGLAAVDNAQPAWVAAVWDNIAMARRVQGIRRLYVINHRNCAAISHRFGPAVFANPEEEFRLHGRICQEVVREARRRDPGLEVECGFMELDGSVRLVPVGIAAAAPSPPLSAPDQRATFVERVRARVAGAGNLAADDELALLQVGIVEHGLSASEAGTALRSVVAESDGRLGREGERSVEAFLEPRAGRRRLVSQGDFEAASRLLRSDSGNTLPLEDARRRVKEIVQRRGYRPRGALWPPFSRRWYRQI